MLLNYVSSPLKSPSPSIYTHTYMTVVRPTHCPSAHLERVEAGWGRPLPYTTMYRSSHSPPSIADSLTHAQKHRNTRPSRSGDSLLFSVLVLLKCAHSFTFMAFSRGFLSKATYNKFVCQKKEKPQYISVGTVRMSIEPSAKHFQSLG